MHEPISSIFKQILVAYICMLYLQARKAAYLQWNLHNLFFELFLVKLFKFNFDVRIIPLKAQN